MKVFPRQVAELNRYLQPRPLPADVIAFVHDLETASTKPNVPAEPLSQKYLDISQKNKTVYKAGLGYILQQLDELRQEVDAAEMALRKVTAETWDHFGKVTQIYTWNTAQKVKWNVFLNLRLMPREPNVLTVGTNIFLIDNGAGVNDEDKRAWKTHIGQAWSNTHCFEGTINGLKRIWALRFELNFVDANFPADRRYDVTVHPAAPDILLTFDKDFLNRAAAVGGIAERKEIAAHNEHGTRDLGNWGKGDYQGVVHEFGHMLGCPDEYSLHSFNGKGYGVAYNPKWQQPGLSTNSIMNNTDSDTKIKPRHLDYVRHVFEDWQQYPRNSLVAVKRTSFMQL